MALVGSFLAALAGSTMALALVSWPDLPAKDDPLTTVFALCFLVSACGGGLISNFWVGFLVCRRYGLTCPACSALVATESQVQKCLTTGKCPACEQPMCGTSGEIDGEKS